MHHSRQFVLCPDPHLHEHAISDVRHDVSRCSTNHGGLADVVGVRQAWAQVTVGVADNQVRKWEVDCRRVVNCFERCVNGWRRAGGSDRVLSRARAIIVSPS